MAVYGEPVFVYWLHNNLYLNITNRCSNCCWFCFRNYKQGISDFNLKLSIEPSEGQVLDALKKDFRRQLWKEVVFCGFGEPTARLDLMLTLIKWIKTNSPAVLIRLDTNGHGYLLNDGRDVAKELKSHGLDEVSVSLNGHNQEAYNENCRPRVAGAFEASLDFVRKAKAVGLNGEISASRMPEVDIGRIASKAKELGVPLHIRDYVPCFW